MIPTPDAARLGTVFSRESRSLMQYLADAFPWASAGGDAALTRLRAATEEQRAALGTLARYLTRHGVPLMVTDSYPASFTTMNFVAVDYLLPRVAEDEKNHIAALEKDRAALADPAARAEVDRLLEVKRRGLKELMPAAA